MRDSVNCDLLSLHNYTSAASERPIFPHLKHIPISRVPQNPDFRNHPFAKQQQNPQSPNTAFPQIRIVQVTRLCISTTSKPYNRKFFISQNELAKTNAFRQQTLKGLGMFWFPLVAYLFETLE